MIPQPVLDHLRIMRTSPSAPYLPNRLFQIAADAEAVERAVLEACVRLQTCSDPASIRLQQTGRDRLLCFDPLADGISHWRNVNIFGKFAVVTQS